METGLLAIGEIARLSGLTVSALRFYDGAGVFAPAVVDEHSGYRWYRAGQVEQARLIARMRRVGLPLPEIGRVLACRAQGRPADALVILDAHLLRLEAGLSDARRELSTVRAHLLQTETPMTDTSPAESSPTASTPATSTISPSTISPSTNSTTLTWITLPGRELAAELLTVRFAMAPSDLLDEGEDNLAVLRGVLFDLDPDDGVLRLVATDRYRMAVSSVPVSSAPVSSVPVSVSSAPVPAPTGPPVQFSASARFVDEMIDRLRDHQGPVRLGLGAGRLMIEDGAQTFGDQPLPGVFPDYRRLIPAPQADPVVIDVGALRSEVAAARTRTMIRPEDGATYLLAALALQPDGEGGLRVVVADPQAEGRSEGQADGQLIGVNQEFLLQALNARTDGRLLLELDGPIAPLAIRDPARAGMVSLLMPCRFP